ncbi:MAG: triose-phosphate isomerase [Candidatus Hadarchaeum sp.]|uniref:triose-phosphate isomerase n=1 Tax=Candidatus Hadarchaeum sp. TaxID=2883567 RepID=UPI003D14B069
MLETPIVIVNFKTYPETTGEGAVKLARLIFEAGKEHGVAVAVAPQVVDIYRIACRVEVPVLAQHVDPVKPGKNTGWITPESVRAAGAVGTLVNHAEHKIPIDRIAGVIERAREVGLSTVACAADIEESREIAGLGPEMIAVEPPELIGTGISVSKAKPEVVAKSVRAVKEVNSGVKVLCGAGITKGEDVARALELGAEGVLLASGIVCAQDQRAAIEDILRGVSGR